MVGVFVFALLSAPPSPAPSTVPKTIITVRSSPLCTTVQTNVQYTIQGLQANDRLVNASEPIIAKMGPEFIPKSTAGDFFANQQAKGDGAFMTQPGGLHDVDPRLLLDNAHVRDLATKIIHNIAVIDTLLSDTSKFPNDPKTDTDGKAKEMRAQLEVVETQQKNTLNIIYGLLDTFSLQALAAKGDGTQGAINFKLPNAIGSVAVMDQDVTFKDVTSATSRAMVSHATDPTVDQNPAISQKPKDMSNNPMARFYYGVQRSQEATAHAEDTLMKTISTVAASCRQ